METVLEPYRRWIYLGLLLLTIAGVWILYKRSPSPEPIEIEQGALYEEPGAATPSRPPEPMTVHVVGAVREPGVYVLNWDARVVDAVRAAGGLTEQADAEMINLAERLSDGQQVRIPALGADPMPTLTRYPGTAGDRLGAGLNLDGSGLLNINSAGAAELATLPGIGPVLAERIVAYRSENGPFRAVDDIIDVSGIGNAIYADIRELITVE
ncbi:MAG: ComEA family DNA-binding protein [Chloroflexi bacterium]|nr:ComEA family DNA-binding protein [Chloroflexota bacterium]